MKESFLRSLDDLIHGDAAAVVAVPDILRNGTVEQHRLLRHDADLRSQEGDVDCVRWSAVNQLKARGQSQGSEAVGGANLITGMVTHHLTFVRIVKPFQELNAGAFPAAAAPDKRQGLARIHRHDQVIQHLDVRSRRIREFAIDELYFALEFLLMVDKLQILTLNLETGSKGYWLMHDPTVFPKALTHFSP